MEVTLFTTSCYEALACVTPSARTTKTTLLLIYVVYIKINFKQRLLGKYVINVIDYVQY